MFGSFQRHIHIYVPGRVAPLPGREYDLLLALSCPPVVGRPWALRAPPAPMWLEGWVLKGSVWRAF